MPSLGVFFTSLGVSNSMVTTVVLVFPASSLISWRFFAMFQFSLHFCRHEQWLPNGNTKFAIFGGNLGNTKAFACMIRYYIFHNQRLYFSWQDPLFFSLSDTTFFHDQWLDFSRVSSAQFWRHLVLGSVSCKCALATSVVADCWGNKKRWSCLRDLEIVAKQRDCGCKRTLFFAL